MRKHWERQECVITLDASEASEQLQLQVVDARTPGLVSLSFPPSEASCAQQSVKTETAQLLFEQRF